MRFGRLEHRFCTHIPESLEPGVNGGENMYRRGGVKLHQGLRR